MAIYRVYAGSDGESHIEKMKLEDHPELGALTGLIELQVKDFDGTRNMDFHPLPERRLIIHTAGEVEITVSDGTKQILRPGDIRLMEDTTGRGHQHLDLGPNAAVYVVLKD